jgi:fatty-acyl-CoA synthase
VPDFLKPITEQEKTHFFALNDENISFLLERYNKINRWVVADMIRRSRYHYPDKKALIFRDKSLTYTELEDECNRVANALIDLGVKKYDRVAILAHNTIHHVLTWLGTAKAGGVYLAINYLLRGKDISYCIKHSESKVFIVEDALYDLVKDVLDEMPTVTTFIWSNQGKGQPAINKFIDFDEWYRKYPSNQPDVLLRIEDPVQMTYTSGTETLPKGVIINNQALMAEYMSCIIDGEYSSEDIQVNALPIYHCAQRDVLLNPLFYVGGTNILLPEADIEEILRTVAGYKASMFFAPPTVWIAILRHPDFGKYDLSSLRKCYYGAAIMPVEILKEMVQRLPKTKIYNYYGQTELAPYHTMLKAQYALKKLGSAGRGGINMETRLEDDEYNIIDRPGVPGEICGRGPHVMMLYFKDPEKTDAAMLDGWFHSGDVGELDEDNFITVVDRKKDMVKTGGENVSTREVEEVIYLDRRVEEVAVMGLPHKKWIEAVTAVVVPKKGERITEEEIMALCKRELSPFKVPKGVIFLDKLPKTPTGKILKRDMRITYKDFFANK